MTQEECWQCRELLEKSVNKNKVDKDHEDCHGWYHCGPECCGGCPVCDE